MAAQITWVVEWMKCKPKVNDYDNVVITAGWRCDGEENGEMVNCLGVCSFSAPKNPFIPYDQLTEQQVLDWCWSKDVNKNEIENILKQRLQEKLNPVVVQLPLPW